MGPHWIEFWWGSQASVVREERLTIMNRYQDSHNWECFMWALLMKSPCSVLHLWPSFFAILEELWKYDMWSKQLVLISLIEILILGLSVSLHEIDCTLKEEAVRSNSSIRSWGSFILISYWISFWTITLCCGRICCLSPPPPKRKDFFPSTFIILCWLCGQITRVFKGKEHAEVEFSVSQLLLYVDLFQQLLFLPFVVCWDSIYAK